MAEDGPLDELRFVGGTPDFRRDALDSRKTMTPAPETPLRAAAEANADIATVTTGASGPYDEAEFGPGWRAMLAADQERIAALREPVTPGDPTLLAQMPEVAAVAGFVDLADTPAGMLDPYAVLNDETALVAATVDPDGSKFRARAERDRRKPDLAATLRPKCDCDDGAAGPGMFIDPAGGIIACNDCERYDDDMDAALALAKRLNDLAAQHQGWLSGFTVWYWPDGEGVSINDAAEYTGGILPEGVTVRPETEPWLQVEGDPITPEQILASLGYVDVDVEVKRKVTTYTRYQVRLSRAQVADQDGDVAEAARVAIAWADGTPGPTGILWQGEAVLDDPRLKKVTVLQGPKHLTDPDDITGHDEPTDSDPVDTDPSTDH